MTVPHPLQLFSPIWYQAINTRTQVDRMPGTDAPCLCVPPCEPCGWPMCDWWKTGDDER